MVQLGPLCRDLTGLCNERGVRKAGCLWPHATGRPQGHPGGSPLAGVAGPAMTAADPRPGSALSQPQCGPPWGAPRGCAGSQCPSPALVVRPLCLQTPHPLPEPEPESACGGVRGPPKGRTLALGRGPPGAPVGEAWEGQARLWGTMLERTQEVTAGPGGRAAACGPESGSPLSRWAQTRTQPGSARCAPRRPGCAGRRGGSNGRNTADPTAAAWQDLGIAGRRGPRAPPQE